MLDFDDDTFLYESYGADNEDEDEEDPLIGVPADGLLILPGDWPEPGFSFGQDVETAQGAGMITGMKLDLIEAHQPPMPCATWMYCVGGRWHQENELSRPEPAIQVETPVIDDFDPFLDLEDLP